MLLEGVGLCANRSNQTIRNILVSNQINYMFFTELVVLHLILLLPDHELFIEKIWYIGICTTNIDCQVSTTRQEKYQIIIT